MGFKEKNNIPKKIAKGFLKFCFNNLHEKGRIKILEIKGINLKLNMLKPNILVTIKTSEQKSGGAFCAKSSVENVSKIFLSANAAQRKASSPQNGISLKYNPVLKNIPIKIISIIKE